MTPVFRSCYTHVVSPCETACGCGEKTQRYAPLTQACRPPDSSGGKRGIYSECVPSRPSPPPAPEPVGPDDYPGAALLLPPRGRGSLASILRRALAAVIDWGIAQLIANGAFGIETTRGGSGSFAPLGIFLLMHLVLVGTVGTTIGHRIVGVQVLAQNGAAAPLKQVLIRTGMVALFFPAIFTASDGRGFHDKVAGTMTIRSR